MSWEGGFFMQTKKKNVIFGSLKVMLAVALMAAVSILCGKYLKIPVDYLIFQPA